MGGGASIGEGLLLERIRYVRKTKRRRTKKWSLQQGGFFIKVVFNHGLTVVVYAFNFHFCFSFCQMGMSYTKIRHDQLPLKWSCVLGHSHYILCSTSPPI